MPITVTFFSESPTSACHKYRVEHPILALRGHSSISAKYSPKWDSYVKGSDIMVFQRNSNHGAAKILLALAADNRNMIYDVDDDIFQIPLTNPVFPLYFNSDTNNTDVSILARQVLGIRLSTAVTVSSERLKEVYSVINPNVHVLPNCVNLAEWEGKDALLDPTTGRIRIFWGGSPTHHQDLKVLKDALPEIARRFGDSVEIVVMGDDSIKFSCPVHNIPYGSYDFFQRIMLSCQIGLAPMQDDPFNRAKSDLRIKEMSCANMAVLASPVGEYAKAAPFATLCKTTEDWVSALSILIRDEAQRNGARKAAREWVEGWDIHKKIGLWIQLFEEIYDHNRRSSRETIRVQSTEYTPHVFRGGKVRVG